MILWKLHKKAGENIGRNCASEVEVALHGVITGPNGKEGKVEETFKDLTT